MEKKQKFSKQGVHKAAEIARELQHDASAAHSTSKISIYFYTQKNMRREKTLAEGVTIRAYTAQTAHFQPPPYKILFYSCL